MSSTQFPDTIYALATSPGKSGVAVIRLSGPHALPALQSLTGKTLTPRTAQYVTFHHDKQLIDRGLALYFANPYSFTGEDVAELHLHGSGAVIRHMLDVLGTLGGLRPAEAGEFTRRAFLNGKMDLIEAEGLADLIDAETREQKSQALRQMEGGTSQHYEAIRIGIIECLALLEAYIDFPDEEIPDTVLSQLVQSIETLKTRIACMLNDQHRGERLRDGITIVILGAPNAGKSSLLNAIAGRDAAIVSSTAGTTRDAIEIHLDMAGYPACFIDTAGLRDSSDAVEQEGIRRALQRAEHADIKLVLFDASADEDKVSQNLLDESAIKIITKSDLAAARPSDREWLISTETGQGMEALLKEIETRVISLYSNHEAPVITRARHRAQLTECLNRLEKSGKIEALELRCEELRLAAQAVGKITGKIQVDEVLEVIFKRFCIGK